jgi:hypothetical protein
LKLFPHSQLPWSHRLQQNTTEQGSGSGSGPGTSEGLVNRMLNCLAFLRNFVLAFSQSDTGPYFDRAIHPLVSPMLTPIPSLLNCTPASASPSLHIREYRRESGCAARDGMTSKCNRPTAVLALAELRPVLLVLHMQGHLGSRMSMKMEMEPLTSIEHRPAVAADFLWSLAI